MKMNRSQGKGCLAAVLGLTSAFLLARGSAGAAIEFERMNSSVLAGVGPAPIAAAWGDFDGDGRPDLALADLELGVRLLRNLPTGFQSATSLLPSSTDLSAAGVSWVDYDNDGDLDLFVVGFLGTGHAMYRNRGDGTFERVLIGSELVKPTRGMVAVWADADGDGFLDVFISNGGGASKDAPTLFFGSQSEPGSFRPVLTGDVPEIRSYGAAAAWGDYDGDGDVDLMAVTGVVPPNPFFRNDGGGMLVRVNPSPIETAGGPTAGGGMAWGDYDNDGDLDLLVTAGVGEDGLYRNEGNGSFKLVPGAPGPTVGAIVGVVWADFDNDARLDLLLANREGRPCLFRGLGDGRFERIQTGPLANQSEFSNGIAVSDFNRDGRMDVAMANWPGGAPAVYANVGATNRWLQVRLVGTVSNRQGIGAKVRVMAGIRGSSVTQMRQIGGEDGWGRQEAVAHFGLGDATKADTVRVEWPSGRVSVLTAVGVDQMLTIQEEPAPRLAIVPPGGLFTNSITVVLRSTVAGGEVRYTIDGQEPGMESILYSGPILLRSRTTIRSRVFLNGFPVSDIVSAEFLADPGVRLDPPGGRFTNQVLVLATTRVPGATIRYSTNGNEVEITSPIYSAPIRLTSAAVIKVRAFFDGFPVSETVSGQYQRVYAFEGDGIAAPWRVRYFGDGYALDPRAGIDSDPDGDGSVNLQEFIAGSDPLDPLSGFEVGIRAIPEIRFKSVPGKKYRIVRRDSVTGTPTVVAEGIVALEASTTFVDVEIQERTGFYVVEPVP